MSVKIPWHTSTAKLSLLHGLFHGSRMLIGAVHSLYLISTGLSLKNLAVLQIAFSSTVLLLELPTGIFSDSISRKGSVLISCLLLSFFYLLCLGAPSLNILIVSEIVYGAGLSFIYGALEGWMTTLGKKEFPNDPTQINYFGHLRAELSGLCTMIAGLAGALMIAFLPNGFRYLYILCAAIMWALLYGFFKIEGEKRAHSLKDRRFFSWVEIKESITYCFKSSHGRFYLALAALLTAIIQPIYHYWQPLFMQIYEKDLSIPKSLSAESIILGITFFCYCFMRFILNRYIRTKLLKTHSAFTIGFLSSILAALFIFSLTLLSSHSVWISILLFASFQGTSSLVDTTSESQFLSVINPDRIASILSSVATLTRVWAIAILFLLAGFVTQHNLYIFFIFTGVLFLICAYVFILWRKKYESH